MGTLSRPRRRVPPRAALALGLLALLVAGCDLFKPATPETGGGGSTLLPDYSQPESCLTYMRIGIERRDNEGQDAYNGALDAAFQAIFDPAVWNSYPGIKPDVWDLAHETQFLPLFMQVKAAPYEMKWLSDTANPYDSLSADGNLRVLHRRYEVRAQQSTGAVLIAVGYADLYFTRISGTRWALTTWKDRVDPVVTAQPADPDQQSFGSRRLNAGSGG